MAISVTCGQCGHTLRVKDEYAGKRGKCPKCQTIILIPSQADELVALEAVTAGPSPGNGAVASAAMKGGLAAASSPMAATTASVGRSSTAAAPVHRTAAPPAAPARAAPVAHKNEAAPPLTEEQLRARIFAGFQGSIERVPTSLAYRLGILLTAVFMVLLPLIYIGIIGLACLAVYWHLTNNYVMLGAVRGGRAMIVVLMIYLAPLVVGAILIVFMVKPLFARPAKEPRRRSVTPHSDPLLFEFVERICQLVGAPMPRRIDIDCEVNASASFRRGWLSVLSGRDLVLTIGMPLVTGLSLQQLAGVLAHEFGHFSQGAGMRLTYVTRTINHWFVRVVYERDEWDMWLAGSTEDLDLRIAWILWLAQACVWCTRKILWCLMYLGHIVAGFMLRQMEFDADMYETRVAGSQAFAATCRKLRLIGVSYQGAQRDLGSFYREGRLGDNMPLMIQANLKQLPKKVYKLIDEAIAKSETGLFDDHPADKDRIAAAQAENAAGAFQSELPASVLFANVEAAAKNVTWDFYCASFGRTIDPNSLHPTSSLLARQEQELSAIKSRDRFFAGAFSVLRPLQLPPARFEKTAHPAIWQQELAQARAAMEASAAAYAELLDPYDQSDTRLIQARQARSVLSTGVRLQAAHFEQPVHSASEAHQQRERAEVELSRMGNRMEAFEVAAGNRLMAAVSLLFDPAIAARVPRAAELQREVKKLLPIVSTIATNHGSLFELRNNNATLAALLGHLGDNQANDVLIREILDFNRRVREQLTTLRSSFERIDYPFDHAKGEVMVSHYLLKMIPPEEEVGAMYQVTDDVLDNLMNLYARALGRLCVIAETVEADQGYQPLPRVKPEEE